MGKKCTSSGSSERWQWLGSPLECAADPARPVGTQVAACACQVLGCTEAVLPTGSPKPGNRIARTSGLGPWGRCDSRGDLPRESQALFPSNTLEIPSAAKQYHQATPTSGVPSSYVPQPYCAPACAHTHTHNRGAPFGCAQLQEPGVGWGAKGEGETPARGASVCSGSEDFRAVFLAG